MDQIHGVHHIHSVLLPVQLYMINGVVVRRPSGNQNSDTNIFSIYNDEQQKYIIPAVLTPENDVHYHFHVIPVMTPDHYRQYIHEDNIVTTLNPERIHEIQFYYPYYIVNGTLYDTTLVAQIRLDAIYVEFIDGNIVSRYVTIVESQYVVVNMTHIG